MILFTSTAHCSASFRRRSEECLTPVGRRSYEWWQRRQKQGFRVSNTISYLRIEFLVLWQSLRWRWLSLAELSSCCGGGLGAGHVTRGTASASSEDRGRLLSAHYKSTTANHPLSHPSSRLAFISLLSFVFSALYTSTTLVMKRLFGRDKPKAVKPVQSARDIAAIGGILAALPEVRPSHTEHAAPAGSLEASQDGNYQVQQHNGQERHSVRASSDDHWDMVSHESASPAGHLRLLSLC